MRQTQAELMDPIIADGVSFDQVDRRRRRKVGLQIGLLVVTHTFCFLMGYYMKTKENEHAGSM